MATTEPLSPLSPIEIHPYMTVVEGRKPRQKTHKTLGAAKLAFDTPKPNPNIVKPYSTTYYNGYTHGWGTIYEFKMNEWVPITNVPQPTKADAVDPSKQFPEYETRPWRLEK